MTQYYAIVEAPFVWAIANALCDMDVINRCETDKRLISLLTEEEKQELKGFEELVVSGKLDPQRKKELIEYFERGVGANFLYAYNTLQVSFCKREDIGAVLSKLYKSGDRFTCGKLLYDKPDENKLNITEE